MPDAREAPPEADPDPSAWVSDGRDGDDPGASPRDDGRLRIAGLAFEQVPDLPEPLRRRRAAYDRIGRSSAPRWVAGGGLLYLERADGLYLAHLAAPGEIPVRLPIDAARVRVPSLLPHPERPSVVLVLEPPEGAPPDAGAELVRIDLDDPEPVVLADHVAPEATAVWTRDARHLTVARATRVPGQSRLDLVAFDPPGRPQALPCESAHARPRAWFPDGRRLLVEHPYRHATWVSVLDTETGALEPLRLLGEHHYSHQAALAGDGRSLIYLTSRDGHFRRLWEADLVADGTRMLTEGLPSDVDEFAVDGSGELIALVVNDEGYGVLHVIDRATGEERALPPLPRGVVSELAFDPTGTRLAMTIDSASQPADVHVLDVQGGSLQRWTASETGRLDPAGFREPELVRYPTFDLIGDEPRTIPAFVCRPPGEGPFPVLIVVHGGPEAQYRPVFSVAVQYYVRELGIAVVAPNVRGSSGYGAWFATLDDRERRPRAVRDIGALLDWIALHPALDGDRVAISGSGYGGFLALAALAEYGHRLQAGVDLLGVSDWVTFLENAPRDEARALGHEFGDVTSPEMRHLLERMSPGNLVNRLRAPLFVAADAADPARPQERARTLVDKIRRLGTPVWFVYPTDDRPLFADDRRHEVVGAALSLFLVEHLVGGTEAPSGTPAPAAGTL